jgi:uncharacterized protein (TIGR03437 family)
MGVARKFDLDRRLETYFATLRSSSPKDALTRRTGNWQIYAAVTGSAMAMVTNASASSIGSGIRDVTADPARVLAAQQHLASSKNPPLVNAVRLALAKQDLRERLFHGAGARIGDAAQAQAPIISVGGVVPVFSSVPIIQPGEWVSIYGSNLASGTAASDGDFPTSLGGTSVEVDGKAAYLLFVSPGQINFQAPDDTAFGKVSVVVTTAAGSATSTVTLSQFAPSFLLLDTKHVAGIILRSNHSGAYGGGTYDILGPTGNSFGYPTVAAQAGDTVELFAVGFGPTTPVVPAGQAFSGSASLNNAISLYIHGISVRPAFVGLSSAGVYQINLIVPPGLGGGDVPIQVTVGGVQTQLGVLFSLQSVATVTTNPVTGGGSSPTFPKTFFNSTSVGGTGGGTGSARTPHRTKPYEPKLRFTQE